MLYRSADPNRGDPRTAGSTAVGVRIKSDIMYTY